jgi:F0F1-type ATP synthase membrane subunit b/b'
MDKGKAILADIKSKISAALADARAWVDANIGPLIDKIKAAIAQAKAKVAELIAKAKEEIMKFAKAMLAQIRQGLAELMSNLPKDPCLRGLLGSVATGAAAAVIGG